MVETLPAESWSKSGGRHTIHERRGNWKLEDYRWATKDSKGLLGNAVRTRVSERQIDEQIMEQKWQLCYSYHDIYVQREQLCCQKVGDDSNILAAYSDHETFHPGNRHNEIRQFASSRTTHPIRTPRSHLRRQ